MRLLLVVVVATALTVVAWCPVAVAAPSRCEARSGRTVAQNAIARVYRVDKPSSVFVRSCLRGSRRIRLVTASLDFDVAPGPFALRGRVLAYASPVCSRDDAAPQ